MTEEDRSNPSPSCMENTPSIQQNQTCKREQIVSETAVTENRISIENSTASLTFSDNPVESAPAEEQENTNSTKSECDDDRPVLEGQETSIIMETDDVSINHSACEGVNVSSNTAQGDKARTDTAQADTEQKKMVQTDKAHTLQTDKGQTVTEQKYIAKTDKAHTSQTDTAQADTAHEDTAQKDMGQRNTAQTDTAQTDTAQTDTAQTDTAQTDTAQTDTAQTDTAHEDTAQKDMGQRNTAQTDTAQINTEQTDTAQTDTAQINTEQEHIAQTDTAQTDTAQINTEQEHIAQTDEAQTNTAQTNTAQVNTEQEHTAQTDTAHEDTAQKNMVHTNTAQINTEQEHIAQTDEAQTNTAQKDMAQANMAQKDTAQTNTTQTDATQTDIAQIDAAQEDMALKDTEVGKETSVKQENSVLTLSSIKTERKDLTEQLLTDTHNAVINVTQPSQILIKPKEEVISASEVKNSVSTSCEQSSSSKQNVDKSTSTTLQGHKIITLTRQPQATSGVGTSTVTTTSAPKVLMLKSPLTYVNTAIPGSLAGVPGKKIVILKNKQVVTLHGKQKLVSVLNPVNSFPNVTAKGNEQRASVVSSSNVTAKGNAQRASVVSSGSVKSLPALKVYPTTFSDLVTVVKNNQKETNMYMKQNNQKEANMYIKQKMKKINKTPSVYTVDNGKMVHNKSPKATKQAVVFKSAFKGYVMRRKTLNYELRTRDSQVIEKMRKACYKTVTKEELADRDYRPNSAALTELGNTKAKTAVKTGVKRKSCDSDEKIIKKSVKTRSYFDDESENELQGEEKTEVKETTSNDMGTKGKNGDSEKVAESQITGSSEASKSEDPTKISNKQPSKEPMAESSSATLPKDDSELTTDELEKEVQKLRKLVYPDGKCEEEDIELSMQVETEDEYRRNQNKNRCNQLPRSVKGKFMSRKQYNRMMRIKEMNEKRKKEREKMKEAEQEEAGDDDDNDEVTNKPLTVYCSKCVCYHPQGICSPPSGGNPLISKKTTVKIPPKVIKNKKVESCKNSSIKALATMPDALSLSYVDDAHGFGIFTTEDLPKGSQLGPVEGEPRRFCDMNKEQDLTNVWVVTRDVFKEEEPDEENYICMDDEMNSNWCRYIRGTTFEEKSNLKCVIDDSSNSIYLKTTRPIDSGEELLYLVRGHEINEDVATENERTCPLCKITFDSSVLYAKHVVIFHTFGRFKYKSSCKICLKIFYTSKTFQRHCKEEHGGAGGFKCMKCGKEFLFEKLLQLHLKDVHDESAKFPCETCEKVFTSQKKLHNHMKNIHKDPDLECETCGKKFKNPSSFSRHQNVHNPEPRVTCEFCGKNFRDAGNLKVHLLTHSKQKPFQCTESGCDAAYTTKQQLQFHYKKTHNYTAESMPEIIRSLPYTMEAYAMRAETEADASKDSDTEDNSINRSPRDDMSEETLHSEEWLPNEHSANGRNASAEAESHYPKDGVKPQCPSKTKTGSHYTRSKKNSDHSDTRRSDRVRHQTPNNKRRDQLSSRERESPNMNANIHHQMSPQTSHLWGQAPSVDHVPPYGAPYMDDLRHIPALRYPQPYNTMDIHHNHVHDVHPPNFSNPNEFDSRVMQLMEL